MTAALHVLDHSLPEQSGYAFRSHAILRELTARGIDVAVLTGPKHGPAASLAEEIDGIRYRRTPGRKASRSGVLAQVSTILDTRRHVSRCLRERPSRIVHAHSPCLNGLAAIGLGSPVLYEMRSSWEDAAASFGATTEKSARYRLSRALETFVAGHADEVVVISQGLKKELVGRGIPEKKITVVPNAVPAAMFELAPAEHAEQVRARYGLAGARVIGFFGSFFEWEGLDLLLEALPEIAAALPDVKILFAGGGQHEQALRRLTAGLGLEHRVVFAGRIPHGDVRAFYAAADVMAYPRIAHRLTEMVTPLKPLEAMAQCRPVVASDVGGHREQIDDGRTGFLFRAGDRGALARRLIDVLASGAKVRSVVDEARDKVEREHRWSVVAERYLPLYERMTVRSAAHPRREGRPA